MVMYKIKIKGGKKIKSCYNKSRKWVQINTINKRLKLKKSKFRKGEYLSSEIGLNKNKLKIQKLNGFKENNDPSPKMLKE